MVRKPPHTRQAPTHTNAVPAQLDTRDRAGTPVEGAFVDTRDLVLDEVEDGERLDRGQVGHVADVVEREVERADVSRARASWSWKKVAMTSSPLSTMAGLT